MTTYMVTTTAELESAFNTAVDGDRIELAAGSYDTPVSLMNRDFATGLTITSADPADRAVLTDALMIQSCSGVIFEGIDVQADSLAPNESWNRVELLDSSDITLRDVLIKGYIPTASEGSTPTAPRPRAAAS